MTFLGTGGGVPSGDRSHASILLEEGGGRWLLDAGEPCSRTLKGLGVPFGSLEAVFISHGHSDHIGGLPMLIQGAWLEGRRPAVADLPTGRTNRAGAELAQGGVPAGKARSGSPSNTTGGRSQAGVRVVIEDGRLRVSVEPTSHLEGCAMKIDPKAAERFLAYSVAFDWRDGNG